MRNKPISRRVVIYTDASLSGFGGVALSSDGMDWVIAGRWSRIQHGLHINLLELIAVRKILFNSARRFLQGAAIDIVLDNTTAMYQLIKGRSNLFKQNAQLHAIHVLCEVCQITIVNIRYINTSKNPADFWSRVFSSVRTRTQLFTLARHSTGIHTTCSQLHGGEDQGRAEKEFHCSKLAL